MTRMDPGTSATPAIAATNPLEPTRAEHSSRESGFSPAPKEGHEKDYASAFGPANPAMSVVKQIESSLTLMDSAHQQLQSILNTPRLNPLQPGYMEQANREFAQFMELQLGVSKAAFGLELASKTIEVGTNGINTLSRTQT